MLCAALQWLPSLLRREMEAAASSGDAMRLKALLSVLTVFSSYFSVLEAQQRREYAPESWLAGTGAVQQCLVSSTEQLTALLATQLSARAAGGGRQAAGGAVQHAELLLSVIVALVRCTGALHLEVDALGLMLMRLEPGQAAQAAAVALPGLMLAAQVMLGDVLGLVSKRAGALLFSPKAAPILLERALQFAHTVARHASNYPSQGAAKLMRKVAWRLLQSLVRGRRGTACLLCLCL